MTRWRRKRKTGMRLIRRICGNRWGERPEGWEEMVVAKREWGVMGEGSD
jgi:hypothetical protein